MSARKTVGFTLVELMIVVAIIGVLAALAIYGVSRYLKHSKTAEATRNLGAIETGARQQYQRETPYGSTSGTMDFYVHTFCPSAPLTPSTGVPKAMKVKAAASEWDVIGWTCLKFSINEPQFYAYQVESNSATGISAGYTAYGYGDLDGNSVQSTFVLRAHGGQLGDAVRDSLMAINEDE